MKVEKKDLGKSQIELIVELTLEEFAPYIEEGAKEVSKKTKIEGFRPGKVPLEILKQKIGEMSILEKAAQIAIDRTLDKVLEKELDKKQIVGSPRVDITKLAPNNPMEYKMVIALLPEVTLGEYKNLKVKPVELKIDEKEVEKTLENIQESRAKEKAVDREVKEGDKVVLNIQMFLDKVPIEGGQSKETAVMIGKEYFVPGFDKKLIGMKKKEERKFELPYPNDFHQKNLAGKMVEFKVVVNNILERELPKLDDEFSKMFGAPNMEDFKKSIKENIETEKKFETEKKTEVNIIDKILEKTNFSDLPEVLINNESEKMMMEIEGSINSQGGKFEDYLASIKKTRNELVLDLLPDAIKRVKSALLMREIAEKEKVVVTKEDIDKRKEELLKQYQGYAKVEERIKDPNYRLYLSNFISNQKVMEKLKEWNLKK